MLRMAKECILMLQLLFLHVLLGNTIDVSVHGKIKENILQYMYV